MDLLFETTICDLLWKQSAVDIFPGEKSFVYMNQQNDFMCISYMPRRAISLLSVSVYGNFIITSLGDFRFSISENPLT